MLIVTASINRELIDTILIQNVGPDKHSRLTQYKIRQPEGYDKNVILHNREEGYRVLLESVLRCLNQGKTINHFVDANK